MKRPQTITLPTQLSIDRDAKFQTWAAVAFITALVLAAFWKLTAMKGLFITDDMFASDLMNENFPYRFSLGSALKSGHFPLWAREIYSGFPLLARAESGVCYPFNLVLFGLFSPYVALNITILLTIVTAGVGMYFYTREIGSGRLASIVGGIAFCFSGYLVAHLKHLSIANAACWLPVGLTLLERAVRRNHFRSLLWFGVVFGLQHLAGNAQSAYYCGVLYFLYFAFRLLNHQREFLSRSKQPKVWMKLPQTAAIIKQDSSLFRMYCVGGNHSHRRMVELAGGWEGDLEPFVEQCEFLQPSSNVLYGIASSAGYANLTPNYIIDIWGDQNRPGVITRTASTQGDIFQPIPLFWKSMRMHNVKYLTSFWPFAPAPNIRTLGTYGGAYFYQNDDFLPRAYLVGNIATTNYREDALRVLASDAFDPVHSVLLEAVPPNFQLGANAGGHVEFLRYSTNDAEMKVRTARDAILVFSDSYYPGWVADVDGHGVEGQDALLAVAAERTRDHPAVLGATEHLDGARRGIDEPQPGDAVLAVDVLLAGAVHDGGRG